MHRHVKSGFILGAAAMMAISLVGCGTNANSSPSGKSTASGVTATQGQPLVMSTGPKGNFTENFNPFSASADDGTSGFIYEPLFYYNEVGPQVYPILGTTKTWSNGNTTLTVQLNSKAKWTDGKAFTAQDVVFTFDLLKKFPAADLNGVWQKLSSVKAQGKSTVVFQFKSEDVPFAMYVLQQVIVPQHIWSSVGDPTKFSNPKPIGTGPFTLERFSSQEYVYKANPNYYKGTVPVPEVDIPAYGDNNSNNMALSEGTLDWDGAIMQNIQKNYVDKSSDNHYWFPPDAIVSLVPNLKDPLLSNAAVRQAISLAINREDIQNKGEYGLYKVAQPDGILPTMSSWVDPNLPQKDKAFTYNPSAAEKVLERAGFKKNSSGIFVSLSGKPLSLTLLVVSGWTDWVEDASLLSQELKQVGIQLNVQQEQYGAYMAQLQSHKFQLAMSTSNSGPNPYYIFQSLLYTNQAYNYEQFSDPAVDAALTDFSKTTDATKQKQDIYTVEKVLAEQLPVIPVVYGIQGDEYRDNKYTGWPDANNPYVTPAPWAWPAPEIVIMHLKPVSK
ncbi:ABC transporter substrate-binding protein [Alicyclobacillus acidoterrestris]|uniref:ABC transporter substrate-binding protein n=1 Tax=Alicyclobacillus acidoterrestris (strain ATCC 49025 / DSM 3922 / CIP 106132 / NCIMB 13137 / GD3B) TaxID=1356854 RepID=T0BNX9_ALIAG|nr:ABC transporter substrate-binding protein [Alicyclobacillus acidoterrestris]EPZ42240.1 hypothetical protein N007_15590 [Alicyclobacillus acidoterrestris ATCC 49025]UNO47855.1 ABC transporter substrate-binding protein [Alicyclobacillus acidoterrestris]GEO27856.1 peptide ABC transporter substrate-binding protein [Alicyclobacillus acidoterrestris]